MEIIDIEAPLPTVRAVARCGLLLGLLTAVTSIHILPCCCFRLQDAGAALPIRLLGCGVVQAAAAALSLLLPGGRARRGLAFLALATRLASLAVLAVLLCVFTSYWFDLAGYGDTLLNAVLLGEGTAIGVFVATLYCAASSPCSGDRSSLLIRRPGSFS